MNERTDGKSLEWEDTANEDVFQAPIGKLTIRIGEYFDDDEREIYYRLDLLNADGRLIESLYPHQLTEEMSDAASVFNKILEGARRKARKVEETLDAAIAGLKALEDEDEIPF
ncbi:MAG: hypothetical protein M3N13_02370 [Candidatus Eremiobacteraeota bacterium]|nr:hypothetical protein [Candidatus Eremiobacteraeota bacterium]